MYRITVNLYKTILLNHLQYFILIQITDITIYIQITHQNVSQTKFWILHMITTGIHCLSTTATEAKCVKSTRTTFLFHTGDNTILAVKTYSLCC